MAGGGGALRAVFTASHARLPVDVGSLECWTWGSRRSLALGSGGKVGEKSRTVVWLGHLRFERPCPDSSGSQDPSFIC